MYMNWNLVKSSNNSFNINRTARSVIEIIRRNGVVPATVAVLNGELHIGENQ